MTKRQKRPCLTMHYADGTDENIETVVFRFGSKTISARLKFESAKRTEGEGECFFDVDGLAFMAWYFDCVADGARETMRKEKADE